MITLMHLITNTFFMRERVRDECCTALEKLPFFRKRSLFGTMSMGQVCWGCLCSGTTGVTLRNLTIQGFSWV